MLYKRVFVTGVAAVLAVTAGSASAREVNIARRVGIRRVVRTFSVNPGDYNRDGREDFFLVRHNPDDLGRHVPRSILFRRGRHRRYRVASRRFGRTDKHDCAWGRANRDKRPDLFCAVPQDCPVPGFIEGSAWAFAGTVSERTLAPAELDSEAAAGMRRSGFVMFQSSLPEPRGISASPGSWFDLQGALSWQVSGAEVRAPEQISR